MCCAAGMEIWRFYAVMQRQVLNARYYENKEKGNAYETENNSGSVRTYNADGIWYRLPDYGGWKYGK